MNEWRNEQNCGKYVLSENLRPEWVIIEESFLWSDMNIRRSFQIHSTDRQTDRQTSALALLEWSSRTKSLFFLPLSSIKFQRENLLNFLPGSRIYILSPPRKDWETAPKMSVLENIQDLEIIITYQRNKQCWRQMGGSDFLKANCSPFCTEDKKPFLAEPLPLGERGSPQVATLRQAQRLWSGPPFTESSRNSLF